MTDLHSALPIRHCGSHHIGSEHKWVHVPGMRVDTPTVTMRDKVDVLMWALPNHVDFLIISFARRASDVTELREARPAQRPLPGGCSLADRRIYSMRC